MKATFKMGFKIVHFFETIIWFQKTFAHMDWGGGGVDGRI